MKDMTQKRVIWRTFLVKWNNEPTNRHGLYKSPGLVQWWVALSHFPLTPSFFFSSIFHTFIFFPAFLELFLISRLHSTTAHTTAIFYRECCKYIRICECFCGFRWPLSLSWWLTSSFFSLHFFLFCYTHTSFIVTSSFFFLLLLLHLYITLICQLVENESQLSFIFSHIIFPISLRAQTARVIRFTLRKQKCLKELEEDEEKRKIILRIKYIEE